MQTAAELLEELGLEPYPFSYKAKLETRHKNLLTKAYHRQRKSPFYNKLPAEIRNQIYEYLLLTDQTIDVTIRAFSLKKTFKLGENPLHDPPPGIHSAICHTCRGALYETYPIIYGRNMFSFAEPDVMQRMVPAEDTESKSQRHLIKSCSFLMLDSMQRFSYIRRVSLHARTVERMLPFTSQRNAETLAQCLQALYLFPNIEHLCVDVEACGAMKWTVVRMLQIAKTTTDISRLSSLQGLEIYPCMIRVVKDAIDESRLRNLRVLEIKGYTNAFGRRIWEDGTLLKGELENLLGLGVKVHVDESKIVEYSGPNVARW